MTYSLVLILGGAVHSVGSYPSLAQCSAAQAEFQAQAQVAGCVLQSDPAADLHRALTVLQQFVRAQGD